MRHPDLFEFAHTPSRRAVSSDPFIDTTFDSNFANDLARVESYNKHLYRPNTYLHKWWARRCGSTFRLILKHLVKDPEMLDYYAPGGLEGQIILDPMMGGGTTIHEAIRLGANVIGADIDPIPVVQVRGSLLSVSLRHLEEVFSSVITTLRSRIAPYFLSHCPLCGLTSEVCFMLYGLRARCSCNEVIAVDSLVLRDESDGTAINLCPVCGEVYLGSGARTDSHCPNCLPQSKVRIVPKSTRRCPTCGDPFSEDTRVRYFERYTPVAVVVDCPSHGRQYASPTATDLDLLREADGRRETLGFGPLKSFAVSGGPKSGDLIRRGIRSYLDLFTSRQLLYMHESIALVKSLEKADRLLISLLISTSLEFNCLLCGYKGGDRRRPGAIRHVFSHHAYSFPHTALENNPVHLSKSSGTLTNLFHMRIRRGRLWARSPKERVVGDGQVKTVTLRGEIDFGTEVDLAGDLMTGSGKFLLFQGSSTSLDLPDDFVDHVVTDPPYYDNVQYSDLASFFRVWLAKLLPDEADWSYDQREVAVDHDGTASDHYARMLGSIFAECYRVLKKDTGRLVFTFHHWKPRGWASLAQALKKAKFRLIARYIVHSENPTSVHIANLDSLTHDAVLVLAPRRSGKRLGWAMPSAIDRSSSEHFCRDCADALGWMLDSDLSDSEIIALWERLLAEPS